jgi:hypothetical protein
MKAQIETGVKKLLDVDDASLYAKLGAYSLAYPQDVRQFAEPDAQPQIDADTAGPLSDSIELGKRILKRWNRALYEVACTDADPQVKKTLTNALNLKSADGIAAAITGILIATFSVGPAIATIVGVLLARVLLPAAGKEVCAFWKEKLPS